MVQSGNFRRSTILALAVAFTAACGDDDGPTGLDPNEFEFAIESGGAQSGIAGTVLDQPLVVRVSRRDNGAPAPGVGVSWSVPGGGGEPTRTTSTTNAGGEASTLVALGDSAGSLIVEAAVRGLDTLAFAPHTVLPVPTIASLTPTSVDPGDTVAVAVDDLPDGSSVEVLFDGVPGVIASQQSGTPAVLNTIVPAPAGACSSTNQSVDVRLRVAGITTASRMLTVSVPADPFQVGQVLVMQSSTEVQCALLPTGSGAAKYLLVALNGVLEADGLFQVTLGAGNVALTAAGSKAPEQPGFHGQLRAFEASLVARGLPQARPSRTGASLFAGPNVGDKRSFRVLNNVAAASPGGTLEDGDFDRVTATLRFVGPTTLLYIDDASPTADSLTQAEIDQLGEIYDRLLFDADRDFYGEPSDVDANEQVIILLSATVNKLTERDAEGVVVGFFFGLDLFASTACSVCRFSNEAELFYGLVPDPDGDLSDPRQKDRVLELLPGVMVHETQHMINFNYKVFVNNQPSLETLWLSEGLAHMAEELGGDAADDAGETDLADELYLSNFGRAARYLEDPGSSSLTVTSGSGTLGERGSGWLFLRWIAEQYGDFIFRDMKQAAENGVENVENQTGEDFLTLFADWAVALWADDQYIAGLSDRYQIPKWQLRSILELGDPPQYVLQPAQQTFGTFRSDSISQFLVATSPFYVELDAAGDSVALQIRLESSDDARLAVLRFE